MAIRASAFAIYHYVLKSLVMELGEVLSLVVFKPYLWQGSQDTWAKPGIGMKSYPVTLVISDKESSMLF